MTNTQKSRPEARTALLVTFEVTEVQAAALAQFCKRVTFGGVRECAVDDAETYTMLEAIESVRRALADKGHAPR